MNECHIATKLTALRTGRNLTQDEVGAALGVSGKTISKWEKDLSEPALATLRTLADLYKVSVDELLDPEAAFDVNVPDPDEDEVISGGNFHGQPMALSFDFLKIAVAEYADVSERRIERMVNPQLNSGLPAFLTKHSGVCSGFMIAQYSAASMVSENKIYAHPASVDSIPSSANQEDHVSMGTTAARTARMILDNSQKVLGIELFAAYQALYLRGIEKLAPATRAVYDYINKRVSPVEEDVVMYERLKKFDEMIKNNEIAPIAEAVCGKLL